MLAVDLAWCLCLLWFFWFVVCLRLLFWTGCLGLSAFVWFGVTVVWLAVVAGGVSRMLIMLFCSVGC